MHTRDSSLSGRHVLAVGLAALVGFGVVVRAADKAKFISSWRSRDIVIDGISTDWPVLSPVARNVRLSIGLANDRDFLYLALETSDPATSVQLLRQGLIVWFDAQGGKKRQFGIRYPIGFSPEQTASRGGGPGGREGGTRSREVTSPDDGLGPGALPDVSRIYSRAESDGRLRRFEILGDGKEAVTTSLDASAPLELKTGWSEGSLCYEVKIPLASAGGLPGLGVQIGALVGLGLETPKTNRDGDRSRQGGGMGGMGGGMGGRGGMGGMGGQGGFGGPRGARPVMPEPLKLWTTIRIAAAPDSK